MSIGLLGFGWALLLAVFLTPLCGRVAKKIGAVDAPTGGRKHHDLTIPLLGGVAFVLSWVSLVLLLHVNRIMLHGLVAWPQVIGIMVGLLILVVGGILDDRFVLPARLQFLFPLIATITVVLCGVSVTSVRSLGVGLLSLAWLHLTFLGHTFSFPADLLALGWILGLTYTTKVLDGVDGLAATYGAVALLLIAGVAMRPELVQPDVFVLTLTALGALLGFLAWNWPPATIFLGEVGSTSIGFLIACLAILSGSKIATTLLLLAVPIIDFVMVILARIHAGQSPTQSDGRHLHIRLRTAGVPSYKIIIAYAGSAFLFGVIGLLTHTAVKAAVLLVLACMTVVVIHRLQKKYPAV